MFPKAELKFVDNFSDKGKIDWKRTIRNNDLVLGTNRIIYKSFIVKQNK